MAVAGLLLARCGSSTGPTSTTAAVLVVTVSPNPIMATNSLDPLVYDYMISYSTTLTETAGVGGTLHFITGTLYDPLSGVEVGHTSYDTNDLLVLAGANTLPPKGTITVQQQISYRLASRGRAALLFVEAEMLDNNGHLLDPGIYVQVE